MKSTWSMQIFRKKRVNSTTASSLRLPRPSKSLRHVRSQFARSSLYLSTFRAKPRATDQIAPVSRVSTRLRETSAERPDHDRQGTDVSTPSDDVLPLLPISTRPC